MQDSNALATAASIEGQRRPDKSLLFYYLFRSLLFGPAFPFAALYSYFRYQTLRYDFDDEGVSMRWGVLFRREISLTYARIQDIHLVSNILERWLGLARIQIQTASGSAVAEITIEGLPDFEAVRDFLYERMRSSRGQRSRASVQQTRPATAAPPEELPEGHAQELPAATVASPQVMLEVVQALRDTTAELRALRQQLEDRDGRQKGGGS